jgi:hypothetical protein
VLRQAGAFRFPKRDAEKTRKNFFDFYPPTGVDYRQSEIPAHTQRSV